MDHGGLLKLSYESLVRYTDNFSESNYIGHFQFGKLYHGKIVWLGGEQHVVVKIWEIPEIYDYWPGDNELRLVDELILLRHNMLICHPGMVTLYGFCFDGEHLGVVYEFKAYDSVFNLIPKDSFTWLQRIKVALGFARLLRFLHAGNPKFQPFIVRNLDAAHILLDEDYNAKLCDFGMVTGGIFPDRTINNRDHVVGCYGYIDLCAACSGEWSDKQDVFAFGVILLGLISNRVFREEDRQAMQTVHGWAREEYGAKESDRDMEKLSLVHENLTADPDFYAADGRKITYLAMLCIDGYDVDRPNMKQVLRRLLSLKVVKQNADFLGVNKIHHPREMAID